MKWKSVNSSIVSLSFEGNIFSGLEKQFTLNVQVFPVVRTPEIASLAVTVGEFKRALV
jgi:hypothetical protein